MKTQKMSLANIQGKLSRIEMKNIMAGSDEDDNIILCGGSHPMTCTCGGGPFGCCQNTLSACLSANGCTSSNYLCAHK